MTKLEEIEKRVNDSMQQDLRFDDIAWLIGRVKALEEEIGNIRIANAEMALSVRQSDEELTHLRALANNLREIVDACMRSGDGGPEPEWITKILADYDVWKEGRKDG